MKSLETLELSIAVLQDVGSLCDTSTERDELTLISRWEHEDDSFLTIVLPTFAKALEQGLASGHWPKTTLTGFHHLRGLPVFLRGFLLRVFNDDGSILGDPDANSIWAVRQICYSSHKVERDVTPSRKAKALAQFIQTDQELDFHDRVVRPDFEPLQKEFRIQFGEMMNSIERLVADFDLIPRHGPGAVADRLKHPERWLFRYWPERLEAVFPRWRYTANLPHWEYPSLVPVDDEIPVRVISVPKTQSTPRIIAIEPSSVQFAQQGLKRAIYEHVAKSHLNDLIGFVDQTRNQRMAREASITGDLATLDLSEASDRVSMELVTALFEPWPHVLDFLKATRSEWADVGGVLLPLTKFASMGSALTFPIEAMVFSTIALLGMRRSDTVADPTRADFGTRVSVYGDDIIVPTGAVADVRDLLAYYGFKVNERKSFWTGWFRESCGKDYYRGHDVSVVRLRADVPTSRQDATLIRRLMEFRNRCYRAGLWKTVAVADRLLSKVIRVRHRNVYDVAAVPAQTVSAETVLQPKWTARWNESLHRWEERHLVVKPKADTYSVDDSAGLYRWFTETESRDSAEYEPRFESQERPDSFHIKIRGVEVPPWDPTGREACGMILS